MFRSLNELELTVRKQIDEGLLEQALQNVTHFIKELLSYSWCNGIVLSSPVLDKLCLDIGAQFLAKHSFQKTSNINNNLVVYIATQLYAAGGHTAIIEEFISSQPDKQHLILMTDVLDEADLKIITNRFKNNPAIIKRAPAGKMTNKLAWLMQELTTTNPHKTFLFNHQFDAVAIAAVQPQIINDLIFYHHSDYQFTLGVHLDNAKHIDIHNLALFTCSHDLQVKDAIYWPLTSKDLGTRPPESFNHLKKHLITCSSGSLNKYNIPYAEDYKKLIAEIIKTTDGYHVHIGAISPNYLKVIRNNLKKNHIDESRFIHIPWVKSVWQTVIEKQIDVYICSFPYGGGKTAVEIMGSGTPIIVHDNYATPLGGGHIVYPQAYQWRKSAELLNILQNIKQDDLITHSHLSRQHYEKYHQDNFIKHQLAKPAHLMQGVEPQPFTPFVRDELQSALDTYAVVKQKIKKEKSWRNSKTMQLLKKYYKKTRRMMN